jgi:RNA polymerase sigma-70 factor (ECF subfamily)
VEDARQETFLRVIASLRRGDVKHPERLGAYVNVVCNNVVFEVYRAEARTSPLPDTELSIRDSRPDAESGLVSRETKQQVREVLEELSPRDRELLRLVFFEEQDASQVCQQFNVARNYLRVLLHRAKRRFRTSLEGASTEVP